MSDDKSIEQRRRRRADIVEAFSRRAWQPSEHPGVGRRLLAGGVALIVVVGVVVAIGALTSYEERRSDERRARAAGIPGTALGTSGAVSPSPSPTSASPSRKPGPGENPPGRITAPGGSGAASDPASGSGGSGGASVRKAQAAKGVQIGGRRRVLIRNVLTGMCVDVPGYGKGKSGGPVQQHTCSRSTGDNQLWDLVVASRSGGPKGASLFTIRNAKDGLCLDLPGYGTVTYDAHVKQYQCRPGSGDNQMWFLEQKRSGQFYIRSYSAMDHRCLDVSGVKGSGGMDAVLTVYPCSIDADHLWSIS